MVNTFWPSHSGCFSKKLDATATFFGGTLPIGLPHMSTKDVYYKGFRIPKASTIFMNVHGIFHDPQSYDNPDNFDPERFIKTKFGTKGIELTGYRKNLVFGAGRRLCPGELMARRTIMLNTMNLLWAFNFKKDGSGSGGYNMDAYSKPGVELAPKLFTCDAEPRSALKAQMIKERYARAFPNESGVAAMP